MNTRFDEFKLGWKVLFAGLLGVALGASPLPYNVIGFTVAPLSDEFGWSRTEILMPITIFGITASLLAPFFGWLADKYGVRRVALWSLLAFAISFSAISLTRTSLAVYYGLWFAMGLVGIGSTPVTWSRAVNMWFFKGRGLALGMLLLGTSLPPLFIPHIAAWAIENTGWRSMFLIVAMFPLFVALPICFLYFREPTASEQPQEIKNASGKVAGLTLGQALKNYRFWIIWFSVVAFATAFGGAFVNMVPILMDHSFTTSQSATVMTFFGIGIFTGRIITGLLLDRFWAGFVGFPLLCLPAISCFILIGDDVVLPMAILAGYLIGFAAGAESDFIAYLSGRYFGMANYGKIYGMLYMPFGLATAISPLLYAYIRDTSGSYNPMLSVAIFLYILGGTLLLFMGKYPTSFDTTTSTESEAKGITNN